MIAPASSVHLLNLETLNLSDNLISDKGAEARAASPTFTKLRGLNLRMNPRLTPPGKQLLRDKSDDRVWLD